METTGIIEDIKGFYRDNGKTQCKLLSYIGIM